MKQYTSQDQTAKLIELGFEKPKMAAPALKWVDGEPTFEPQYTIGELIEMLPPKIETEMEDESDDEYAWLSFEEGWDVLYRSGCYIVERIRHSKELIDALFEMLVHLKEEGVI